MRGTNIFLKKSSLVCLLYCCYDYDNITVVRVLNFVFVSVDDLLVTSDTEENQVKHISQLFERLSEYYVSINADKCVFGQNSLEFLGHLIDSYGIQPLSTKVEAIQKILPPTSLRQLRQFLGMVNFHRRFTPN